MDNPSFLKSWDAPLLGGLLGEHAVAQGDDDTEDGPGDHRDAGLSGDGLQEVGQEEEDQQLAVADDVHGDRDAEGSEATADGGEHMQHGAVGDRVHEAGDDRGAEVEGDEHQGHEQSEGEERGHEGDPEGEALGVSLDRARVHTGDRERVQEEAELVEVAAEQADGNGDGDGGLGLEVTDENRGDGHSRSDARLGGHGATGGDDAHVDELDRSDGRHGQRHVAEDQANHEACHERGEAHGQGCIAEGSRFDCCHEQRDQQCLHYTHYAFPFSPLRHGHTLPRLPLILRAAFSHSSENLGTGPLCLK